MDVVLNNETSNYAQTLKYTQIKSFDMQCMRENQVHLIKLKIILKNRKAFNKSIKIPKSNSQFQIQKHNKKGIYCQTISSKN